MIVRATSDLHLSTHTAPYVFEALEAVKADVDASGGAGATVLAGDIFDQGLTAHMPTWNRLRDLLHSWDGFVYVIAGNHDQYAGARNILEGLERPYQVRVISEPMWTQIGPMVPYVKPEAFADALTRAMSHEKPTGGATAPFLWCHQGFKGAYVNSMRRDTDGVPCNAVPEGFVTTAGHYHMPQNIAWLLYCGSPYEVSFHEEGQRKGWLRWDDFPHTKLPERIPYELSAPKHYTIRWDPKDGPPVVPAHRDHDIIRVVAEATRDEVQAAKAQLEEAGLEAAPILVQPTSTGIRPVVNPFMELREVVDRYAHDRWATDPTGPEPEHMHEWAERQALWAGL